MEELKVKEYLKLRDKVNNYQKLKSELNYNLYNGFILKITCPFGNGITLTDDKLKELDGIEHLKTFLDKIQDILDVEISRLKKEMEEL